MLLYTYRWHIAQCSIVFVRRIRLRLAHLLYTSKAYGAYATSPATAQKETRFPRPRSQLRCGCTTSSCPSTVNSYSRHQITILTDRSPLYTLAERGRLGYFQGYKQYLRPLDPPVDHHVFRSVLLRCYIRSPRPQPLISYQPTSRLSWWTRFTFLAHTLGLTCDCGIGRRYCGNTSGAIGYCKDETYADPFDSSSKIRDVNSQYTLILDVTMVNCTSHLSTFHASDLHVRLATLVPAFKAQRGSLVDSQCVRSCNICWPRLGARRQTTHRDGSTERPDARCSKQLSDQGSADGCRSRAIQGLDRDNAVNHL